MRRQSLRIQGDGGGGVIWTDTKQYHVSCLLDRLAMGRPSSRCTGPTAFFLLPQRAARAALGCYVSREAG
jgi:hypothetical protein